MGSGFRDTRQIFKIAIFGHETCTLGNWPKFRRGINTLFYRGAQNWAHSHSTGNSFWDTGQFSNLSYFGMNFRSCIYTLFLLQSIESELIFALRAAISEIQAHFQNYHIWAWNLARGRPKFHKLHIYTLSTPEGPNWAYFCSMGSGFQDTEPFKIAIFGHETWQVAKASEVAHILSSSSTLGVEIEPIFALQATVSEIRASFQNCHIWAWNLVSGQGGVPRGVSLRPTFNSQLRTGMDQFFCFFWMNLFILLYSSTNKDIHDIYTKFQKLHMYPISTPGGRN